MKDRFIISNLKKKKQHLFPFVMQMCALMCEARLFSAVDRKSVDFFFNLFIFFHVTNCHFDPANMFVLHKMGCNCFHHPFVRSLSLFFKCCKKKKILIRNFISRCKFLELSFSVFCGISFCLGVPEPTGQVWEFCSPLSNSRGRSEIVILILLIRGTLRRLWGELVPRSTPISPRIVW